MNKILIIDDDRELCALIKRSVQAENIEADFCNTGKEGLQKLKEQEYQLVVLDVMMPGMDGFETLEEIRKENSLPILMFTSKNEDVYKRQEYHPGQVSKAGDQGLPNRKHLCALCRAGRWKGGCD